MPGIIAQRIDLPEGCRDCCDFVCCDNIEVILVGLLGSLAYFNGTLVIPLFAPSEGRCEYFLSVILSGDDLPDCLGGTATFNIQLEVNEDGSYAFLIDRTGSLEQATASDITTPFQRYITCPSGDLAEGTFTFTLGDCAEGFMSKRPACKHQSEQPVIEEKCPTCKSEKRYPAYWCSLLNKLCCRTDKLPYTRCDQCEHWEV